MSTEGSESSDPMRTAPREEVCEKVWRDQGYTANNMVIREAQKAYKAIEAGYDAGWQAAWHARDQELAKEESK